MATRHSSRFSLESIQERARALPDTYSGNECKVSMHAEHIIKAYASDKEPMRFVDIGISFCCRGEFSSEVNLVPMVSREGELDLFTPSTVFRFSDMGEDCSLIGMTFSPYYVYQLIHKDILPHAPVGEFRKVRLDENERKVFENLAKTYLETLQQYGEDSPLSSGIASTILMFAIITARGHGTMISATQDRPSELSRRFSALLIQSKGTKRSIGWFADALCVSTHYLSIAVKQTSGQSVKSLIDKAVITEIKILLRQSDLTIAQIADKLDFPSSSFLCKYFKAHTGETPLNFKKAKQ